MFYLKLFFLIVENLIFIFFHLHATGENKCHLEFNGIKVLPIGYIFIRFLPLDFYY